MSWSFSRRGVKEDGAITKKRDESTLSGRRQRHSSPPTFEGTCVNGARNLPYIVNVCTVCVYVYTARRQR